MNSQLPTIEPIIKNVNPMDDDENDSDGSEPKPTRRSGRRKIKIEYIEDKNRRHITFSKRKAGIMKKAYELSTLTGTQVLLLVVSETGLVYTFTTVKLQPIVTKPEGKNLIQTCLNAPDPSQEANESETSYSSSQRMEQNNTEDKKTKALPKASATTSSTTTAPSGYNTAPYQASSQQPYGAGSGGAPPSSMVTNNYGAHPGYMNSGYPSTPTQQNQPPQSPQQQQQQSYGQMPSGAPYYGNQSYMQQQQQHGYWAGNPSTSPSLSQQEDSAPNKK